VLARPRIQHPEFWLRILEYLVGQKMTDVDHSKILNWGTSERVRSMMGRTPDEEFYDDRRHTLLQKYCVPETAGSGHTYYFSDQEINFVVMEGKYFTPKRYIVRDNGWITFNFSLKLLLDIQFHGGEKIFESEMSWILFRLPPGSSQTHTIPGNEHFRWVTLCCRESLVENLLGCNIEELRDRNGCLVFKEPYFYESYKFTPVILQATEEIFKVDMPLALRANFMRAKADELITMALSTFFSTMPIKDSLGNVEKAVEDVVARAAALIENSLSDPPTVETIAELVGFNKASLIHEFRARYGMAPSEYIKEKQLDEARNLLEKTRMPLSEISVRVGYRHQCNLSTAFRSKFGMSPLEYRKKSIGTRLGIGASI